jgi:hypothetical protein
VIGGYPVRLIVAVSISLQRLFGATHTFTPHSAGD